MPNDFMRRRRSKWTFAEESALASGVERHGVGHWAAILKDREFKAALSARDNIALKDKWRNLAHVTAKAAAPSDGSPSRAGVDATTERPDATATGLSPAGAAATSPPVSPSMGYFPLFCAGSASDAVPLISPSSLSPSSPAKKRRRKSDSGETTAEPSATDENAPGASSSTATTACPLCRAMFPNSKIVIHAMECVGGGDKRDSRCASVQPKPQQLPPPPSTKPHQHPMNHGYSRAQAAVARQTQGRSKRKPKFTALESERVARWGDEHGNSAWVELAQWFSENSATPRSTDQLREHYKTAQRRSKKQRAGKPQSVVYFISLPPTGVIYIGSTNDLPHRLRQHNGELKGGALVTGNRAAGREWSPLLTVEGLPEKAHIRGQFRHVCQRFEFKCQHKLDSHGKCQQKVDKRGRPDTHPTYKKLPSRMPEQDAMKQLRAVLASWAADPDHEECAIPCDKDDGGGSAPSSSHPERVDDISRPLLVCWKSENAAAMEVLAWWRDECRGPVEVRSVESHPGLQR